MIDIAKIAQDFSQDGYAIVRGILDPRTVEATRDFLSARLEGVNQEISALLPEYPLGKTPLECGEALGAVDVDTLDDAAKTLISGHFPLAVRLAPELLEVLRNSDLQALLRAVLGSEQLFAHLPPTARFIFPGNRHSAVPPHQDISYNHHLSNFVVTWVPLVPVDGECGGVTVYEGTHRMPEILGNFERPLWLQGVPTDGFPVHPCVPMDVGDVLLLSSTVVHGSMANISARARLSIDFRLFDGAVASTKHALDMQNWQVIAPTNDGLK